MATPITLRAGKICLAAVLNDTVAARDFLQRLPLSVCGNRRDSAYGCGVAIGRFDPLETQFGWQAGDLCLDSGWLSIRLAGCHPSEAQRSTMVIGRFDRASFPLLEKLPDQVRFTICVTEMQSEAGKERNAS